MITLKRGNEKTHFWTELLKYIVITHNGVQQIEFQTALTHLEYCMVDFVSPFL